jgi:hypothetical protein
MDRATYLQVMRLVAEIVVLNGLPGGNPCWMAEKIGSLVTSPLEEAIERFRNSRRVHRDKVKQYESLIRPYNGQPWAVYQEILRTEPLKSELDAIDVVIEELYTQNRADFSKLQEFFTPENTEKLTIRAYRKCT